jgi:phospholipid/cholesterol/gamma-HCH transport system substrate-binding protein
MLSNEQRIGIFFVVGLVLIVVAVELTLGLGLFQRRYPLHAAFRDVQGLDVGADVRLAGIRAGRVDAMRIENDLVIVTMAIDAGLTVKTDSVARLDLRALSGERFVALSLGSPAAPVAEPGTLLDGETPASLTDVVDQLGTVAAGINELTDTLGAGSERLLTSLAELVEENRAALTATAEHVASITGKLDAGTGSLGLLVNDPALYDRLTTALGTVNDSAEHLGEVAQQLADGQGTLGKLLAEDDGLYAQVRETVDSLEATARNAEEITNGLRNGDGTLGRALTDESLYAEAEDTLRTVNRATQSVEDQAAVSLLGTIVTSLF